LPSLARKQLSQGSQEPHHLGKPGAIPFVQTNASVFEEHFCIQQLFDKILRGPLIGGEFQRNGVDIVLR
jgi:hypothetical protein